MTHKLLVLVPFRDREEHLKEFIPYITTTLNNQTIQNYKIVIVEQDQGKLFNKGILLNIGFDMYKDYYDYICLHDIDMIGENFEYQYEENVTLLSTMWRERDYKQFYKGYLGGVVLFPKEDFIKINGSSNEYWGWGAEDDDLSLRCQVMNVKVTRKNGRFYSLPHERIEWKDRPKHSPGYLENLERLNKFKCSNDKLEIIKNDGLTSIKDKYSVIDINNKVTHTMVKVKI